MQIYSDEWVLLCELHADGNKSVVLELQWYPLALL